MTEIFFADTYALIEVARGNPRYRRYLGAILVTSEINIAEFYYFLLSNFSFSLAEKYLKIYHRLVVPLTFSSIKHAMLFKLKHKKEKLSYADCLGYAIAKELCVRFLTGDDKFKDKENVEFTK